VIAWFTSLWQRLRARLGGPAADLEGYDPEIGEVFYAELADVTQTLRRACASWRANPADGEALKSLRRGFHTIKGSAPLVGATALADFGKQLERLLILLIERPRPITPEIVGIVDQAIAVLPAFANAVRESRPPPPQVRAISQIVQRLTA
jgi:chemosensory pili system protein ChpA (sensor histidine kinase/response regulator)